MNTAMVLRRRTPIASLAGTANPHHLMDQLVTHAARRHWKLRRDGQPLCNVELPEVHSVLYVPPQQVALETSLRNDAALARYYTARCAYRARFLSNDFQTSIIPPADQVMGRPRRALVEAGGAPCVIGPRSLQSSRTKAGVPPPAQLGGTKAA